MVPTRWAPVARGATICKRDPLPLTESARPAVSILVVNACPRHRAIRGGRERAGRGLVQNPRTASEQGDRSERTRDSTFDNGRLRLLRHCSASRMSSSSGRSATPLARWGPPRPDRTTSPHRAQGPPRAVERAGTTIAPVAPVPASPAIAAPGGLTTEHAPASGTQEIRRLKGECVPEPARRPLARGRAHTVASLACGCRSDRALSRASSCRPESNALRQGRTAWIDGRSTLVLTYMFGADDEICRYGPPPAVSSTPSSALCARFQPVVERSTAGESGRVCRRRPCRRSEAVLRGEPRRQRSRGRWRGNERGAGVQPGGTRGAAPRQS